jgi:hypothetical protein
VAQRSYLFIPTGDIIDKNRIRVVSKDAGLGNLPNSKSIEKKKHRIASGIVFPRVHPNQIITLSIKIASAV